MSALQQKLKEIARAGEERDAIRRAKTLDLPYVDLRRAPISIEAVKTIKEEDAKKAWMVAVQIANHEVAIAAVNPKDPAAQEVLEALRAKKYTPKLFVASRSGVEEALRTYAQVSGTTTDITGKVEIEKSHLEKLSKELTTLTAATTELQKIDLEKATTSGILEVVLAGALALKASDIHFETEDQSVRLRYRLDGVLHDVLTKIPKKAYHGIVSRIKLLSGMKINVRDEAQDGRFTIGLESKDIEMRVSIIPSEFGESIVMRVLDPDAISVEIPQLGLRADDLAIVEYELKKPNGLVLNTGPTGSGKTTTLYAFMRRLTTPDIKTVTVEDPIEYHLKGISQTQVDTEAGYTFAKGLRAIVRQDPDVILVGEIRDFETADIALEAALTGHLVLSTLHTNDAIGAVPRLVDLGVKPQSIGPALSLVIAQRLVRKLCEKCKKPVEVTVDIKNRLEKFLKELPERVDRAPYGTPTVFESVGCEACGMTGFRGRVGIFEFFKGGPELEEIILDKVSELSLKALAKKQGMVSMQADGILKVISGGTTFAEVESVTGPLEWS